MSPQTVDDPFSDKQSRDRIVTTASLSILNDEVEEEQAAGELHFQCGCIITIILEDGRSLSRDFTLLFDDTDVER